MLQLDARLGEIWGFSPLIFVRGHFYDIGIAALLFRVKPRHVEKFRKFRFADVGKSELGKKERTRNMPKTSTVHRTGDLIILSVCRNILGSPITSPNFLVPFLLSRIHFNF